MNLRAALLVFALCFPCAPSTRAETEVFCHLDLYLRGNACGLWN